MASLRDRVGRVRIGLGLAAQAAIAAGLAWYVSHELLSHVQPFFAPIAAVVVLAISVGQRMRRAFEIVAGNAVGILLGEILIYLIGRGAWQVSLVVLLAILIAIFAGGSASLVTQAASSASLVATLVPIGSNYFLSRFIDAVVGGVVGLGVMALLLPLNPLRVAGRAASILLDDLAAGLSETADALDRRSADSARSALDRLRDTEAHLRSYRDAINAGKEISTVAPLRWRHRSDLARYLDSYVHVARALRNSRVLVRRALAAINDAEPVPPELVAAVHSMADSVSWLRRELATGVEPEACREAALRAVRAGASAYLSGLGFSGGVVVAQIRSAASDLVSASGLSPEEAHREVRKAVGRAKSRTPMPPSPAPAPPEEHRHQTP